jgi:hypothetical protein
MKKAGRFRWRATPSIATPPCLKPSLGERLIAGISKRRRKSAVGMVMEFSRVISPLEDMEIWNASGGGFSFVISYESRSGPGFHGLTWFRGVVASDPSEQGRHQDRRFALQNAR